MKHIKTIALTLASLCTLAAAPALAQRIAVYDTGAAKAQFSHMSFAFMDLEYQRRNMAALDAELSAQIDPPGGKEKWAPAFAQVGLNVSPTGRWDERSWKALRARGHQLFQDQIAQLAAKSQRVADPNSPDWPAQEYTSVIRNSISRTGYDQVLDRNTTSSSAGYSDVTMQIVAGIGDYSGRAYAGCFTPEGYRNWTATKASHPDRIFPLILAASGSYSRLQNPDCLQPGGRQY
jgi:hypothetical protein